MPTANPNRVDLFLYILLFIGSLGLLLKSSDWFVEAAEEIGLSLGISPFIIGVTIVAFGTSLPELASSIAAVLAGQSEIVMGNVVGSNIANILLVLGITTIIAKEVKLDFSVLDIDIPFLLGSSFLLWFTLSDFNLSIFETIILLSCLVLFLINSFKREERADKNARPEAGWRAYTLLILGGIFVYLSADWTITAIQKLSEIAQINPELIALSLVALGTSLPEVAVSIAAARRGKTGIAVGNVVGSNIFNSFAVLGIARLFGDLTIPENIVDFSLPFMVAVTLILTVISVSRIISRWEGVLLVILYIYFMGEVFKSAF
ncbi:calcium/sodium antiporter [bacterium]|nr:calcium/sodium antiporter [Bacteroidota bacterium]MDA7625730.1 calcium/sodium antiporter [bacterium]MDF1863776.1 calcium/sodium antiporter [Saprospiraceae bacterium]